MTQGKSFQDFICTCFCFLFVLTRFNASVSDFRAGGRDLECGDFEQHWRKIFLKEFGPDDVPLPVV